MTPEEQERWTKAMNYPLYRKGDIVDGCVLLEDSMAHGCPMVERDGMRFAKTMYGMEEALRLMTDKRV